MSRKRKPYKYEAQVNCHDHFDGSANCKNCGGDCVLTGQEMAYTALVRALFEAEAYHGQEIAFMAKDQMRKSGVKVEEFRKRATETCPRMT